MARTESFLDERRETLRARANPRVNGIDYVEVNRAALQVEVHLVRRAPGAALGSVPRPAAVLAAADFVIDGGDRIRGIQLTGLVATAANVVTLTLDRIGDFSVYTLRCTHPGFDRMLAQIDFGFRLDCVADFDCRVDDPATAVYPPLDRNLLAKDFDSFRAQMLDRMAQLVPEWSDRQVPDLGVTLVEVMAAYADHLSYAQDAAGTEAYIGTARRRASVRRHAQLLGYDVQDGISARVFVQVQMAGQGTFGRGDLTFLTRLGDTDTPVVDLASLNLDAALEQGVRFFEPADLRMPGNPALGQAAWIERPIRLQAAQNSMVLYDWGDDRAVLPAGATQAWVMRPAGAITLRAGDFIALELQLDPVTHAAADADLSMRQVVCLTQDAVVDQDRLVAGPAQNLLRLNWHADDALAFDLPVGRIAAASGGLAPMALAFGNVVLCDHGLTLRNAENLGHADADRDPDDLPAITALSDLDRPRRFRPVLRRRDIAVVAELHHAPGSATALMQGSAGALGPMTKSVWLSDAVSVTDHWQALNTLIFSGPDDRVFVAETESEGSVSLRFGRPGEAGATPGSAVGNALTAHYRIGIGRGGNIGAEAIAHVALTGAVTGATGPVSARNPLPGSGGRDRETVDEIKLHALAGLDDNLRAVTRDDYTRLAQLHPGVQRAHVRSVGHGSWDTFFVAIDPAGSVTVDDALLKKVREHLEPYRLMGQDLVVEAPRLAPLELALAICVCPDFRVPDVRRAVEDRLSARLFADGTRGFFHPDNLTFGAPIYLSRIVAEVRGVAGVIDVQVQTFRKWRSADTLALQNGVLAVDAAEIPVLMNDPNHPERGVLTLQMMGAA